MSVCKVLTACKKKEGEFAVCAMKIVNQMALLNSFIRSAISLRIVGCMSVTEPPSEEDENETEEDSIEEDREQDDDFDEEEESDEDDESDEEESDEDDDEEEE